MTKRDKPEKVRKIISGGCPTEQVLQIHGLLSTAKLRAALSKPALPVFFFFAGVTYDTVTLTRIDRLLDNVILLAYLVALGLLLFFHRDWWLRVALNRLLDAVGLGSF